VTTISTEAGVEVRGVTSVDDELFVLLKRNYSQVAVYNINDYKLLRHLHLPGLKEHNLNDMTSCIRYKHLYLSNETNNSVHRFDLSSGGVCEWSVSRSPRGLSVTPSCNLLVTCRKRVMRYELVELSADSGQCVREIELQLDMRDPYHGVQLTTGQFVICHGDGDNNTHRVCFVDDEGKVTCSYGGQCGSDVGQLNCPCQLAVDVNWQFIFVADSNNHRVVLLNPNLQFSREFKDQIS